MTREPTPAWETSKENAAPLARGRNVQIFEKSASLNEERIKEQHATMQHYEKLVAPFEGDEIQELGEKDDPLTHWLSYIKYHEDEFPSDTRKKFLLYERCTRALVKFKKYENDIRFLRVCVQYADQTDYPGDVFKYLHQRKIGHKCALFWVAWAWVAEKNANYQFAEKVFLKGISKDARPAEMLRNRHKQFQRRLVSRSRLNDSHLSANPHENQTDGDQPKRAVLSGLSETAVRRNNRSSSQQPPRQEQNNRPFFSRASASSHGRRGQQQNNNNENTNQGGFQIFVDDQSGANNEVYDLDPSSRIETDYQLVSQAEYRKENTANAEKWNDRGGYGPNYAGVSNQQHIQSQVAPFAVHVDETCHSEHQQKVDAFAKDFRRENGLNQRAFRECGEGRADRLARDPMRYINDPSKLQKEAISERVEVVKNAKPRSTKAKPNLGFDKKLIAKDSGGVETCFEERRYKSGCYTLCSPSTNVNLYFVAENEMGSTMEMESIEEVEMEEESVEEQQSFVSRKSTNSRAQMRRVLFSVNQESESFRMNASTASSVVNERDAVGAPTEETINTKYAMKELSLMFSSPATHINQPNNGANASIMCDISRDDSKVHNSILAVPLHEDVAEDDSCHADQKFQIFCDATTEEKSVEQEQKFTIFRDDPKGTNENHSGALAGKFNIFCDNGEDQKESGMRLVGNADVGLSHEPGICDETNQNKQKFQIFCDDGQNNIRQGASGSDGKSVCFNPGIERVLNEETEKEQSSSAKSNCSVTSSERAGDKISPFKQNQLGQLRGSLDSLDQSPIGKEDEEDEEGFTQFSGGLTEKLALMEEVFQVNNSDEKLSSMMMKDCRLRNDGDEKPLKSIGVVGVSPFSPGDSRFGDLSRIDVEESRIEESPTISMAFASCVIPTDYFASHEEDVHLSLRQLKMEAYSQTRAGKPFQSGEMDLGVALSVEGTVFDIPNQIFPKILRRKSVVKGEEICVGSRKGVIKCELGRGSYGVVFLLQKGDEVVAVKAQTPIDCLGWEYIVLKRLGDRLSETCTTYPFPKPLSFISLVDGGLMGMTAGSRTGINLVDVVNLYKVIEGGPVPELLAVFYTSRMLQHIETLHWHGRILHCDVKPDNWVLMESQIPKPDCPEALIGADLMLVDFGRAVDLEKLSDEKIDPMSVVLSGMATSEDMACTAMRKGLAWSFDIDTYGICASAYVLLYGIHLEIECKSKRWKPQKPLRRYWQKHLWEELFDTLLNEDDLSKTAMGSRPRAIRQLRRKFEDYLSTKSKDLESLLRHQARILLKNKPS